MICSPILLLLLEEEMEMGRDVKLLHTETSAHSFTIRHYTICVLPDTKTLIIYDSAVCTLETLWEGSNSVMYVDSY